MSALLRVDENPCRPRHFKPPPCAPVVPDGPARDAVETCRTRILVTATLFALVFAVVGLRIVDVVLLRGGSAESHMGRILPPTPPPVRADIVDRNGKLLATTLDSPSLYANPKQLVDAREVTRRLLTIFPGLGEEPTYAKLTGENKSFVWIKRQLTPLQEYEVNALGIPGLQFQHEQRRFYPYGDLAAHVVGYSGIDNQGFAGVERALNDALRGRRQPVELSLDLRLQYILRDELQKVVRDFTAKAGAGIIMNVNTGEIVAMVSLPDFDPNHPDAVDPDHPEIKLADRLFNRATLADYEVGSVFKTFTTAAALDSGATTMTGRFDATHPIHIGRFTISDYHGKRRVLSVPEIYMYSSNIGEARIGLAVGGERLRSYLQRFGLLRPPVLELDEIGKPHYPPVWREVNVLTIAFGHGISIPLINLATAASAMVNGGILHQATLLKLPPGDIPEGTRVISQETSTQMRKLMRLVVEHGTARLAAAPGYVVGGKTGTAERAIGGHYQRNKLISSFIGAFPMNDPKYLIVMMVDEPHGNKQSYGYATAGWTAAPATGRVIQRIAPLLGIEPVDENSPAIVEGLQVGSLQGEKIENY
jgi:cell division protein FtsI (penicillin-binding protein 3)